MEPSNRRDFIKLLLASSATLILAPLLKACQIFETQKPAGNSATALPQTLGKKQTLTAEPTDTTIPAQTREADVSTIALVGTSDREAGVSHVLSLFGTNPVHGKTVLLKPNFNSADPTPASSHPLTIRSLVVNLQAMGASGITLADRSGMSHSWEVMQKMGIFSLASELGFDTLSFEDLKEQTDWELIILPDSHWKNGFPFARPALDAGAVIQTCCLKPHRYGGQFTLSLKNTIGMVGKYYGAGGHNYMSELHGSSYQRLMIAETNVAYSPALVVLDGVEAFIDNGPDIGTKVQGNLMLAGTDRIAMDACGLAALRLLGLSGEASQGKIFDQEQISRAVELKLGIDRAEKIRIITDDDESKAYADQIQEVLTREG
jgi:uncharacterized protein (DUF362 family)